MAATMLTASATILQRGRQQREYPESHRRAGLQYTTTYGYDHYNRLVSVSYDYYNGGNNNGRIQKIMDADSSYTTTFGYDDYNRLSSASASAYTRSYSYDNWGNLTGVTASGAGESGSYNLSYAANGSGAPSTKITILSLSSSGCWLCNAWGKSSLECTPNREAQVNQPKVKTWLAAMDAKTVPALSGRHPDHKSPSGEFRRSGS